MATPPLATTVKMDPEKQPFWARFSIVWLVPVIALAGSLVVAFQSYQNQDVNIRIDFSTASGIQAGKTVVKFRDVEVGHVTDVKFSDDLKDVQVFADIQKELAPYLDDEADFWAVTAQVSAQGIKGLDTVLSGSYIGASWDTKAGPPQRVFRALREAPSVSRTQKGTEYQLRAQKSGSVTSGAPVLLRGIAVGTVQTVKLSDNGDAVGISVFVDAPYDDFVTTATRFWNASGIDFTLGTSGVKLNVESIASLIQGGIVFDTLFSGGGIVDKNTIFDFYKDEISARESIFVDGLSASTTLTAEFKGSLRGLSEGATVSYKGLKVGEVQELTARVVHGTDGSEHIRLLANFTIEPGRMGLSISPTEELTLEFLNTLVKQGLRAQIVTSNILTGSLHIELVETKDETAAEIDLKAHPYPVIPSLPISPETLTAAAEGVMDRVAALPIEQVLDHAISLMNNINSIVGNEKIQDLPATISTILTDLQGFTSSDDVKAMPANLNATIGSLKAILDELEKSKAIVSMTDALDTINKTAKSIGDASTGIPDLIAKIDALMVTVNQVPIGDLAGSADKVLKDVDALLSAKSTRAIPDALKEALDEVERIFAELRTGKAVDNLVEVLDNANTAAQQFSKASEGVPDLVDEIDTLVAKANSLPLQELAKSVQDLLVSADKIVSSPGASQLPQSLSDALDQAGDILAELQKGGAVENLNRTLNSAETAANDISDAAKSLPELVERLNGLIGLSEKTLAAYGGGSPLNREALMAIDEIRKTAQAISSLARTIERKPNALFLGR